MVRVPIPVDETWKWVSQTRDAAPWILSRWWYYFNLRCRTRNRSKESWQHLPGGAPLCSIATPHAWSTDTLSSSRVEGGGSQDQTWRVHPSVAHRTCFLPWPAGGPGCRDADARSVSGVRRAAAALVRDAHRPQGAQLSKCILVAFPDIWPQTFLYSLHNRLAFSGQT